MRALVAVLIAFVFAGCVGAEEEQPDLIGICPYWEPGTSLEVTVDGETIVAPALMQDGFHLDRFWVTPSEWSGEMRAFDANGTQRGINVPGEGLVPVVHDVEINATYQIGLSAPTHGAPSNAGNLTLHGQGVALVTPLYRVCGL